MSALSAVSRLNSSRVVRSPAISLLYHSTFDDSSARRTSASRGVLGVKGAGDGALYAACIAPSCCVACSGERVADKSTVADASGTLLLHLFLSSDLGLDLRYLLHDALIFPLALQAHIF